MPSCSIRFRTAAAVDGPSRSSTSGSAAAVTGESLSDFIRRAAAARADTLLRIGDRDDFADVLGVVHGGGGQARRTGEALTDILAKTKPRA